MNTKNLIDDSEKQTRSGLWQLTEGERTRYALAIVAMAITNMCMFGAPILGGQAIDVIHLNDLTHANGFLRELANWISSDQHSQRAFLWTAASAGLVITGIGGIFLYFRGRMAAIASENIARRLRETLYGRLHNLHAPFFDSADTGDLVQRCSSDVETLRVFLVSDVIEIGRAIMLVICVVPILFAIHTSLALFSLILLPILVVGAIVFFTQVKVAFKATDESEGAMTARLQENLTGIRVVRAFARQQHEIDRFAQSNRDFRDKNNRLIQLMAYYWSISDFFAMSQLGIVLIAGAHFVLGGSLSVGELFVFMSCEALVIWPVRQLGRVLTDSGKAVIALGRVNHVLYSPEEMQASEPKPATCTGAITARNLTVAYAEQDAVLNNLTIDIAPGETIAIVGPPGSGKTTFIRTLLRLYPYQNGSLTLDGVEVKNIDRFWLRSQIGVVLQDPFLYSRSIQENLTIGRPTATVQEIKAATDEAAITSSIENFADGYEEMVGERGVTLSGGQRQRIALARALLKNPPILILDDALSAIDTGTEQQILAALRKRKEDAQQTTIIIAHRLSSVRHADRILVLENGELSQLGTHAELSAIAGSYRRLCEIQGALDEQIREQLDDASSIPNTAPTTLSNTDKAG